MTEQQKDVELIDRVLMKFALSEDSQLEQCLDTFLVPSIAKMGSPYETTKKKVLIFANHPHQQCSNIQFKRSWNY